jgi:hypothetical protein
MILSSRKTVKILTMSDPTADNLPHVNGAVVATYIGYGLERQKQNLRRAAATAPQEERNIQSHAEAAAMRKEKSTTSSRGILREYVLF